MIARDMIICIFAGEELYLSAALINNWEENVSREIEKQLSEAPLEFGLNKELLRTKHFSSWPVKEFNALIGYWTSEEKFSIYEGQYLAPFGHSRILDENWHKKIEDIKKHLINQGWQLTSWDKTIEELNLGDKTGNQVLQYLLRTGDVISLGGDIYVLRRLLEEAKEKIKLAYSNKEQFSVAEVRNLLNTSRRVVIPLLEYMDKQGFTARSGEGRKLSS